MASPVVYGPTYSTYVRTVCMALQEKEVPYRLEEVDIISGANRSPEHLQRHPFGKVPAFAHDGLTLFETGAIVRYIDEAFPGPSLQPAAPADRARMNQIIGVLDSYGYGAMVGAVVMQRLVMPLLGNAVDEAVIAAALPMCETVIAVLDRLATGQPMLIGGSLTLADLYLVPIYDYFAQTPEGQRLLPAAANLARWWQGIQQRPSVVATRPKLG